LPQSAHIAEYLAIRSALDWAIACTQISQLSDARWPAHCVAVTCLTGVAGQSHEQGRKSAPAGG
jgi:hypothetical protein